MALTKYKGLHAVLFSVVAISIFGGRPLPSTVAIAAITLLTIAACVAVVRSWGRWDPGRRGVAILLLAVILVALAQSVLNSATFDLQPQLLQLRLRARSYSFLS